MRVAPPTPPLQNRGMTGQYRHARHYICKPFPPASLVNVQSSSCMDFGCLLSPLLQLPIIMSPTTVPTPPTTPPSPSLPATPPSSPQQAFPANTDENQQRYGHGAPFQGSVSHAFCDRARKATDWVGCLVSQRFARDASRGNPYVQVVEERSDGKSHIAVFRDHLAGIRDHVLEEQHSELPRGVVEHAILMFEIKV